MVDPDLQTTTSNAAIQEGISKINIFTDINVAAVEAEFRKFETMNKGIIDLIPAAVESCKTGNIKENDALLQQWKRHIKPAIPG